jgi:putative NADH-flavin reductase
MNLTIIGASTGIGRIVVKQALGAGHHVTALAENIDRLRDRPNLTKIKGSVQNYSEVKKVISDAHAVIMTIERSKEQMNSLPYVNAAIIITEVFDDMKLEIPLIVVTGFGTGASWKYHGLFHKICLWMFRRKEYKDMTLMEKMLASSRVNWIVVRPASLTDGPLTQEYKIKTHLYKGIKIRKISRADVAHFLLSEAANPSMLRKYPTLTY